MFKVKPQGIFVFVDDDKEEHELLAIAVESLGLQNPVKSFLNGEEAYQYLSTTNDRVFVVISDLNMPKMDGLAFKRLIDLTPALKLKSVPFIFHSNTGTLAEIRTAYSLNIQGFFKKADDLEGTKESIRKIVEFWTNCVHPEDLLP